MRAQSLSTAGLILRRSGCSTLLFGWDNLLAWQSDFAHQFGESRIRTQRSERKLRFQSCQLPIAFLASRIEPLERLILIPQVGVERCNGERRIVAPITLRFPSLNSLDERALPPCGAKS